MKKLISVLLMCLVAIGSVTIVAGCGGKKAAVTDSSGRDLNDKGARYDERDGLAPGDVEANKAAASDEDAGQQ